MSKFRREIPREEFHSIVEHLIGSPVKGARIVEIRCHIHHIEVFTIAETSEGKTIPGEHGEVARDCHVIGIGGVGA